MTNARGVASPRISRLRRAAPGLVALAALSVAALSAQAVAYASELTPTSDSVVGECSNLSVGWGAGLAHNGTSGRAELRSVTVSGLTAGCVGRTLVVSVNGGGSVLSTATAAVKQGDVEVTAPLAKSVDVQAVAEVSVTAG